MIEAGRDRDPLRQWHERDRAGAEIAGIDAAQGEETPVGIEREFGLGNQVAAMEITQKRVLALAPPFDRLSDPFRSPGDQHEFGAGIVADAEIAADIARN